MVKTKIHNHKFVKKFIDTQKSTMQFMSTTIDDFRHFFRVDKEKNNFDIIEAIKAVVSMLTSQLNKNNITLTIEGEEFEYYGLKSEYQQVVMNIINNAKDALVEKRIENPTIHISITANKIIIEDNAGGIPTDLLDRIFEPYFTTKEQGKGTGMGLYMSKMIIEDNMGGTLSVENVNFGAKFSIRLNV